jgi:hypothetical protein
VIFLSAVNIRAQQGTTAPPAPLALSVAAGSVDVRALADPVSAAWQSIPAQRIALNRTPRLYETEPASESEIPEIEVRVARANGKLLVRLNWRDVTEDAAKIAPAPGAPTEGRFMKAATESTSRFFDAAAVMCPTDVKAGGPAPGLQMGDLQDPVTIYYWNAARGPMLMDAKGRETTRRTGLSFPARADYHGGSWSVCFELPELREGAPLAFAVWNGSQQDRDGRKYFSLWHRLR